MGEEPQHEVVIAGAGVAGLEAMLALDALAPGRAGVTIVAPDPEFRYRPLSVAQPFGGDEVRRYRVAELAEAHRATFVEGRIDSVDAPARRAHLDDGRQLSYDSLVVAVGAERDPPYRDALTFIDERSVAGYREMLEHLERGRTTSIAFIVPPGIVWPFPLYELALMTGTYAARRDLRLELTLCTPSAAPLALFGPDVRDAMGRMLEERGIAVRTGVRSQVTAPGRVALEPEGDVLVVDHVVTIPVLTGPRLRGLPHDRAGFIPVDEYCRVEGVEDVYAPGDAGGFPVKQGGLAAQQADVAAAAIAAAAGADVAPEPFRPVLRGMLLTGDDAQFLRAAPGGSGHMETEALAAHALWWPPAKIAGRHLAPALGELDVAAQLEGPGVSVEVELQRGGELSELTAKGHGM